MKVSPLAASGPRVGCGVEATSVGKTVGSGGAAGVGPAVQAVSTSAAAASSGLIDMPRL